MTDSMQRIASVFESARDLTLEAAAVASSRLGESSYFHYSKSIDSESLPGLLNSRYTREVRDGMKRVMSLMGSGDCSIELETHFADIVKNIGSDDVKVRRMVSVYLLRYAETNPNLALLSINSIQRSLSDSNPDVRALALKTLSDINIASLYPIILHSLKKTVIDSSEAVRCQVATTLLKLFREQGASIKDDIMPMLRSLLADSEPSVVSAALLLFKKAFPKELHLLHGHYRRYCSILNQLTENAQAIMIEIFIAYAKEYLPRPTVRDSSSNTEVIHLPDSFNQIPFPIYDVDYDPDLNLFLSSLKKLLTSPNAMVIVAASKAFYQLSSPRTFKDSGIVDSLLRLVVSSYISPEIKELVLQSILVYCCSEPSLFCSHYKKFFLMPSDTENISIFKLKILSLLVSDSNCKHIVNELKFVAGTEQSASILVEVSSTLSVCAQVSSKWSSQIINWLLERISSNTPIDKEVIASQINVLRSLIQKDPIKHIATVVKLSKMLSTYDLLPSAKAPIIWLLGEYVQVEPRICPDVLRRLLPQFSKEHAHVRLQILNLAAKLLSHDIDSYSGDMEYDIGTSRIGQMFEAALQLAKFDDEYDVRDRARMLASIFEQKRYEIATLLLQAPKPYPMTSLNHCRDSFSISELNLYPDMEKYYESLQWNADPPASDRTPCEVKDYSKLKNSFSSSSYFGRNEPELTSKPKRNSSVSSVPSNTFTSSQGKKYQLQSLDEFFSDVSARPTVPKAKRVIIEESTSEETDQTDDESGSSSSDESTASSSVSSSEEETTE
ncbi:AaceriADR335Cp [[Ashbya] aceris (nom. inval.)]|nr:AaceriADR335Cp [[Ashbya] aceris (nom. inval.)]